MACLPTYLRTKYLADLASIQAQLTAIRATILTALENGEVEEYRFNSGEGSQQTIRRSLKELYNIQSSLEADEARILRKLNGRALTNLNLRRKKYNSRTHGRIR